MTLEWILKSILKKSDSGEHVAIDDIINAIIQSINYGMTSGVARNFKNSFHKEIIETIIPYSQNKKDSWKLKVFFL